MGTIASVLQWKCELCLQVNPTEKSCCFNCGSKRSHQDAVEENVRPMCSPVNFPLEENNRTSSHPQLKHSVSYSNTSGKIEFFFFWGGGLFKVDLLVFLTILLCSSC